MDDAIHVQHKWQNMTIYGSIQTNDATFHYVMIKAGCSDNPGVHIKEGQISEGPLYLFVVIKSNCIRLTKNNHLTFCGHQTL